MGVVNSNPYAEVQAKTKRFEKDGANHVIDGVGNHFINGRCVNPKTDGGNIGDTYKD